MLVSCVVIVDVLGSKTIAHRVVFLQLQFPANKGEVHATIIVSHQLVVSFSTGQPVGGVQGLCGQLQGGARDGREMQPGPRPVPEDI